MTPAFYHPDGLPTIRPCRVVRLDAATAQILPSGWTVELTIPLSRLIPASWVEVVQTGRGLKRVVLKAGAANDDGG